MQKEKMEKMPRFQIAYERVLGYLAVLFMLFHAWITFSRHYFTPENRIFYSNVFTTVLKADRWFAFLLLAAFMLYLLISKVYYVETWYRIRNASKRLLSKEWISLVCMAVWYPIGCVVNSHEYPDFFKNYDWFLFDLMVCILLFYPMASLIGRQKAKKYIDFILHPIILASTCFVVWALWNVLHLHVIELPNGLQLGMSEDYTFYPGVNQNIGASIGITMVLISLYMILCHGLPYKIIYSFVLIPHMYATLLTGSRACFLALFVAFSASVFMCTWEHTKGRKISMRILFSTAAFVLIGAITVWLRRGVYQIFESITHLSTFISKDAGSATDSILRDSGRIPIWRSSIGVLFSSAKTFFFGTPIGDIPQEIQKVMASLYGDGKLYAHAHNILLQTGLLMGFPGLCLFVAFLVMMVIRCFRVSFGKAKEGMRGAYIMPIAILAMVVVNMFEPFLMLYCSVMSCLFFLFCGWTTAIDGEI